MAFSSLRTILSTSGPAPASDRGVFMTGGSNVLDYVTISSTGNATDFGDCIYGAVGGRPGGTGNGSSGRGIIGGGDVSGYKDNINYITISSAGNTTDFGDLTVARKALAAASNATGNRGLFGGGEASGASKADEIDYITISSTGNATDFGNLQSARRWTGAVDNATNGRACFAGGTT